MGWKMPGEAPVFRVAERVSRRELDGVRVGLSWDWTQCPGGGRVPSGWATAALTPLCPHLVACEPGGRKGKMKLETRPNRTCK